MSAHGLIGRTGLSLAIRLAGIGLNFLALLVLARTLDPAVLGRWAWACELIALLCVVSGLGFNMIAIRVIPDCLISRDREGLWQFLRLGLIAGLLAGGALGGGLLIALWRGWLIPGIGLRAVLLMLALLLMFTALRFLQEVMRGAGRIMLAQVFEQVGWPCLLLAMALNFWLVPWEVDALALLIGAQAMTFALAVMVLTGASVGLSRSILLPGPINRSGFREFAAGGLPLALCAALSVVLNRGDLILLGALGDAREVAFYTPASRYAALLVLGQAAASMASAGRLRTLWRAGDRRLLQGSLDEMAAISLLFALPFCLILWVMPGTMLGLFGEEFKSAARVLQLLALAQLVNCWTGPVASLVVAAGLERIFTVVIALATLILLVALALLVPRFGMVGAALSSLMGLSTLNLTMLLVIRRRTGLICWARPSAIAALLALAPRMLKERPQ